MVRTDITGINENWRIWSIYNDGDIDTILEEIGKEEISEERLTIVGGDFNIRTGEKGRWVKTLGEVEEIRRSKDKVCGNKGEVLLDFIEERGWKILNGCTEGDWEGEFTFIGGRGSSVIDYIIVNEHAEERVGEFKVEGRIESDHTPVSISIRTEVENVSRNRERGEGKEIREKKNNYLE